MTRYLRTILVSGLLVLLSSCASEPSFRFAVFSDIHIMEGTNAAADLSLAVKDANSQALDFVLVSGDITDMNIGDNLQVARQILDSLVCPYYIIPGNHDTKWSGSAGYNFTLLWGADKFSFDHDGYRFIGFHQGPVLRMDDGHVTIQDLKWLENELEHLETTDQPVILVMHYPLDASVDNWYQVADLIEPYNIELIIHGHGHRNSLSSYEGIPAVMVRSTLRGRDARGGYNIAEVTGDSILFHERVPGVESRAPWCRLAFDGSSPVTADSKNDKRPDYAVNEKYDGVSVTWKQLTGYSMTASPETFDGMVYTGDFSGTLRSLNVKDGTENWSYKCGGPIMATPAVSEKRVVFTSADSSVYALDRKTGKRVWRHTTGAPNLAVPVIQGNTVFVGGSDHTFRAVDLITGKPVWVYKDVNGYVETRPLIYNGSVIFGAWDESLYALDIRNGALLWKWQDGRPGKLYSPAACWPVAADGVVYIVAPDRVLTAIDHKSGKTLWRSKRHQVRETIGISADRKRVYARCMRDTVFAVSTRSRDYREIWVENYEYGYDIAPSMPVECDGTLFFGTKNGLIVASDARTGKLKWKYKLGNALINTVKPLDDRNVIVANMDGIVARLTGL